jgi:hypothetical protein
MLLANNRRILILTGLINGTGLRKPASVTLTYNIRSVERSDLEFWYKHIDAHAFVMTLTSREADTIVLGGIVFFAAVSIWTT